MKKLLLCMTLAFAMTGFADLSQKDEALFRAMELMDLEAVEEALANGGDINAKDEYGNTVLSNALIDPPIKRDCEEMIELLELLLQNGADVNAQNKYGWTPLYYAIRGVLPFTESREKWVELLLDYGVGVNSIVCDEQKLTPLLWAVQRKEREIVKLLLKRGANRNAIDSRGKTVYDWAMFTGDLRIIELFIDLGTGEII